MALQWLWPLLQSEGPRVGKWPEAFVYWGKGECFLGLDIFKSCYSPTENDRPYKSSLYLCMLLKHNRIPLVSSRSIKSWLYLHLCMLTKIMMEFPVSSRCMSPRAGFFSFHETWVCKRCLSALLCRLIRLTCKVWESSVQSSGRKTIFCWASKFSCSLAQWGKE